MEMDIMNESALKEIEILEFRAGDQKYGIGVDEIREILSYTSKPTPVPHAHPFVEGIIMPRDFIITVVDFNKCFDLVSDAELKSQMIINTGFGDKNIAIHVDGVNGIHRQSESNIITYTSEEEHSEFVSGYILKDDNKVELVDFVKLFQSINPD